MGGSPVPPAQPPTAPAARNPVGTHVPVGKGLVRGAIARADQLACEAIQIFAGNPRGWHSAPGDPDEDRGFRRAVSARGLRVFVHAPYLVNLGSPSPDTFLRSVATVAHQLGRAADLGADGLVVHTGSAVDPSEGGYAAALTQVRSALLPMLELLEDPGAPWLLLEPTAGQGRSLCSSVDELAPYLAALDHHPKVGVCLDTCHVFAAGAALDEAGGLTATLDDLVSVAGPGRLRVVHANDSKDPRGSLRDRHERIGQGHIGVGAFRELFAHPATAGVPVIAETPGSHDPDQTELTALRELRRQAIEGDAS